MLRRSYTTLSVMLTICLLQQHSHVDGSITPVTLETANDAVHADSYRRQPNEILPIEPLLIYPKTHELDYRGRNLDKENRIIYVKLLKRQKNYRPSSNVVGESDADYAHANLNEIADGAADVEDNIIAKPLPYTHSAYKYKTDAFRLKDVFYVKSLANGRFSHERIKVYRVPEFYAINVFRNAQRLNY